MTHRSFEADQIAKKYQYRSLILKRKLRIPRKAATGLVGPDCAYHLYGQHGGKDDGKN